MDTGSLIAIVLALIAILPSVFTFIGKVREDRSSGMKAKADTASVFVGIANELVASLDNRVKELESREREREEELNQLREEVSARETESNRKIETLRDKLSEVSGQMETLRRNNYILCEGMRMLIRQIRRSGYEPVFDIDESLCNSMNDIDEN